MIEFLIRNGSELNTRMKKDGMSALHMACQDGNHEVVDVLVQNGAKMNEFIYREGKSCIHIAAQGGLPLVAKVLIENGCKINACVSPFSLPHCPSPSMPLWKI